MHKYGYPNARQDERNLENRQTIAIRDKQRDGYGNMYGYRKCDGYDNALCSNETGKQDM